MKGTQQLSKKLVVSVALGLVALTPLYASAANKLIVKDSGGTVDKFVVTDTGNVGIGTSSPNMAITIDKPGTSGETSMMFHNSGGLPYGQYNSGSFFFMRNNDISVNNGLPQDGDRLGSMSYGTFTSAGYKYGANISAFAKGNWTSTSFPGYLSFMTTAATGTSFAERMRINPDGSIGIGTTAPTQKLEVNGGVRLNTTTTKPACDGANGPNNRGTLWFTKSATGVADKMEVCAKDASENYAWKVLF